MAQMHGPVYDFFRDQGSNIAGFLALVAGLVAYCIIASVSVSLLRGTPRL
jgi:hypothetical protein